ncbi:MAG: hypothetical protein E4G71_02655 [Candidatus Atribacteria bacterium]|nr:MAG: hypothetical protein E4G71_02655 [Candidatus Atribacteria bacterium]
MKVSIGVITKDFNSLEPIDEFLRNASKHNHIIYSIIIVYSHGCDFQLIESLGKEVKVFLLKINDAPEIKEQLIKMGLSVKNIDILLNCRTLKKNGLVPYGLNRNYALIRALLSGTEALIFIDTDVYPRVLVKENDEVRENEIDFIGRHLEYLRKKEVIITTSDYSGYYIIPPMSFTGMRELFIGLQKEAAYEFLKNSDEHNCLNLDHDKKRKVFATNKILGGNVAIKLSAFKELPPFFSIVYHVNGENVLSRGEDTLLGVKLKKSDKKCIDIDTKIFHNTFGNYPEVPDIKKDKSIKDRMYYTCLGWIGRNPFLNWLKGEDVEEVKNQQKKNIIVGSKAVASYLNDKRFLILPEALEISYHNLERVISEYKNTMRAWNDFIEKLEK